MSGPVDNRDLAFKNSTGLGLEVIQGRSADVGGFDVVRVLPTKGRRTIGAWCFVDLMVPPDAKEPHPLEVGPHPHIGLSTVTWLFEGEALHGDSLGTEQVIKPGQLNLMTSGHGIAHSELSSKDGVHGAQMWIAQPEAARHGRSRFEHLGSLPTADLGNGEATVLIGELGGAVSPAVVESPLVGAEIRLGTGVCEVELVPGFEYGVVPIDSPVLVNQEVVEPGWLGLVSPGQGTLRMETRSGGGRLMLVGGEPLGEEIQMWWNFVARDKAELADAWADWEADNSDRFGPVPSSLPRIEAPRPPWLPET
jgi:quercetin 2,3-dioxygenase